MGRSVPSFLSRVAGCDVGVMSACALTVAPVWESVANWKNAEMQSAEPNRLRFQR